MKILPLQENRSTLVEKVCLQLTQAIRHSRADSDELLPPERELAAQFGVSRPVIREAMKRLELQGLLEVKHGIGTRIVNRLHTPLNGSIQLLVNDAQTRLEQSLEVRAVLEPEVARLAAERASAADLKRLRTTHRKLDEARDLSAAIEADMAFHRELASMSGNDIFGLILNSMADLGRASRQATISYAGIEVACTHHARILEAVLKRDARGAEKAMREHILSAIQDLSGQQPRSRK